jgi:hypothetical protein
MRSTPLVLTLLLLAGCSDGEPARAAVVHAPVEPAPVPVLAARAGDSFRELGVRKTAVVAETTAGPVEIVAMDATDGIRLPDIPLPFSVGKRLVLELEWLGDTRRGEIALHTSGAAEVVLDVAYP